MNTILPTTPVHTAQQRHQQRIDDQTWDEYESTRYFLARMRGEQPELRNPPIGVELFYTGGMG